MFEWWKIQHDKPKKNNQKEIGIKKAPKETTNPKGANTKKANISLKTSISLA